MILILNILKSHVLKMNGAQYILSNKNIDNHCPKIRNKKLKGIINQK